MKTSTGNEDGLALVTVLFLIALVSSVLAAFYVLTQLETHSVRADRDGVRGYYAAEGGINFRTEKIRDMFVNFQQPSGTPPSATNACAPGNLGSGDFACEFYTLQDRSVSTYVVDDPSSPQTIVVPRGEKFQNLTASAYAYELRAVATNTAGNVESQLVLDIETRLIPLFQFMIFYNKDLEITPGPTMTLNGSVHTNGDLYAGAGNTVDIFGPLTVAGELYRGKKESNTCVSGPFRVADPTTQSDLPTCSSTRRLITDTDLLPWNGNVVRNAGAVTVPAATELEPVPGRTYWDRADLRVMFDVTGPAIEIFNPDGTEDATLTAALTGCGVATDSSSFYDNREGSSIQMLDVDVQGLLDCAHTQSLLISGRALDDVTDGGLVIYLGVSGPSAATLNNYGVRLLNASELASSVGGAPIVQAVTFVTDQAAYIQGDFNTLGKRPAAVLSDSINILSNNWSDANSTLSLSNRLATSTTVQAALLAGTDTTGGAEGPAGQDIGDYSGGVHNMARMHESWSGVTFTYLGSLVSLNVPLHVDGALVVGSPQYDPPNRSFAYDTDFDNLANLPPLTPRLVYTKQRMHLRDFDL